VRATQLSHWHERLDVDGADLLRFITSLGATLCKGNQLSASSSAESRRDISGAHSFPNRRMNLRTAGGMNGLINGLIRLKAVGRGVGVSAGR
jgi:hypothetical protein